LPHSLLGPVVLNHCFENRMRPPSNLCAALKSHSVKLTILCNRLRSAIKQSGSIDLC